MNKAHVAALIAILLLAFAIRWAVADMPISYPGDPMSGYIVAHHAVEFHEWPTVGTQIGLISTIRNSPFYYYLLIAILLIEQSFWFVSLVNVLLQCLTVYGIYLLGRGMFGQNAGLIAASIASVEPVLIHTTAQSIWSPYMMQPFFVFTLVTLLYGYTLRNRYLLIVSPILLLFSLALHVSVAPLIPLYVALFFFTSRNIFRVRDWIVLFVVCLLLSSALFLPSILQPYASQFQIGRPRTLPADPGWYKYAFPIGVGWEALFVYAGLLVGCVYYFVSAIFHQTRHYMAFIIGALFLQLVAVVIIDPGVGRDLGPVVWAFPVIAGAILATMPQPFPKAVWFIRTMTCAIIIAVMIASDPAPLTALGNVPKFARPNTYAVREASRLIAARVTQLRIEKKYSDDHFFDIYMMAGPSFASSAAMWDQLEGLLSEKFIRNSDTSDDGIGGMGFISLNRGDYRFLICAHEGIRVSYTDDQCLRAYAEKAPQYVVGDQLYESGPLSVFETSRP